MALPMVTKTGRSSPRLAALRLCNYCATIRCHPVYSHLLTLSSEVAHTPQANCQSIDVFAGDASGKGLKVFSCFTQQLLAIDRTQALRSVTAGPLKATIKSSKKQTEKHTTDGTMKNHEKPRYYENSSDIKSTCIRVIQCREMS